MSDDEPQSLRSLLEQAEEKQAALATIYSTTSPEYSETLSEAIKAYEECRRLVSELSIFSPNESADDIATSSLPYLLVPFHLAELLQKTPTFSPKERTEAVGHTRNYYESFLAQLDRYELLTGEHAKLLARYNEDPEHFTTVTGPDAAAKRVSKIANFKAEKALKEKLALLKRNPRYLEQGDEELVREVHLANVEFCVHKTFQELESSSRELEMLSHAPTAPPAHPSAPSDPRHRAGAAAPTDGYSERLDAPLGSMLGRGGPLLAKNGKPLQPFTLVGNRQELKKGVFRPGHNLPTMSIDEYLEEERRQGNIIEGGGEASYYRPEPDEDDMEKADADTYKARDWDDFKDENPRGAGNTLNMG
ncbi:related to TAP42, component of the Tor signaling pathway [Cephalotrichum gorgonifer]|uniref:Related to TAP42, component of the Tor signaling pathway n=1 Tax=Cephalotrichum gorgonifer TaxID=2041049 RepID=A0AAE8MUH6_9PEZI|nr:related to TAP42, component of the Tor signaling pathway [Cephalotrichum gorgonifer]